MQQMGELFSQRLKSLRIENGYTQRELAKMLNVVQVSYLRWEQGKTEPNINNICELCRIFGVTADYLLGNTDDAEIVDPIIATETYAENEKLLITAYRKMDKDKRAALLNILNIKTTE